MAATTTTVTATAASAAPCASGPVGTSPRGALGTLRECSSPPAPGRPRTPPPIPDGAALRLHLLEERQDCVVVQLEVARDRGAHVRVVARARAPPPTLLPLGRTVVFGVARRAPRTTARRALAGRVEQRARLVPPLEHADRVVAASRRAAARSPRRGWRAPPPSPGRRRRRARAGSRARPTDGCGTASRPAAAATCGSRAAAGARAAGAAARSLSRSCPSGASNSRSVALRASSSSPRAQMVVQPVLAV